MGSKFKERKNSDRKYSFYLENASAKRKKEREMERPVEVRTGYIRLMAGEGQCLFNLTIRNKHDRFNVMQPKYLTPLPLELGREQAEITGERLKALLGDKVTSFDISTAVRATETGNIILKHFDTEGMYFVTMVTMETP